MEAVAEIEPEPTELAAITEIAEAVREYHSPECARPGCLLCVALIRFDRSRDVPLGPLTMGEVEAGLERSARDLDLIRKADELVLARRGQWLLAGSRLGVDYDTMGRWASIGHAGINKALRKARLLDHQAGAR